MGEKTYQEPLGLDRGHGADVVLRRENKLVVQDPFGVVGQDSGRMQKNVLVILDGGVDALALGALLGDLHEESRAQSAADVLVVLLVFERGGDHLEFLPLHDTEQLHADVVGGLEGPQREEMVMAPLLEVGLRISALEGVVNVQQGQMITVLVGEEILHLVGTLALRSGAYKHLRD